MEKIFIIEGMRCENCVASVTKALNVIPGVTGVSVSLTSKKAVVKVEDVSDEILKKAIADSGFEVVSII